MRSSYAVSCTKPPSFSPSLALSPRSLLSSPALFPLPSLPSSLLPFFPPSLLPSLSSSFPHSSISPFLPPSPPSALPFSLPLPPPPSLPSPLPPTLPPSLPPSPPHRAYIGQYRLEVGRGTPKSRGGIGEHGGRPIVSSMALSFCWSGSAACQSLVDALHADSQTNFVCMFILKRATAGRHYPTRRPTLGTYLQPVSSPVMI